MIINKVIFSCSEAFSVFWNLNSKIYKTQLGIEPLCILIGKKENTDMKDTYGQIIEWPTIPHIPLLIQITWAKFYYPKFEPETNFLIGDIDLMPLQKEWFTSKIANLNYDYIHLDADGIVQLSGSPYKWTRDDLNSSNLINQGHATNLPGHYHAASGKVFSNVFEHNDVSFEDALKYIVHSGKYNGTRAYRKSDPIEQNNLWCAEECRSSEMVRKNIINKTINFKGFHLQNGIGTKDGDRVDRSSFVDEESGNIEKDYAYDIERLKNNNYVDLHCARPFLTYLKETENILKLANMI